MCWRQSSTNSHEQKQNNVCMHWDLKNPCRNMLKSNLPFVMVLKQPKWHECSWKYCSVIQIPDETNTVCRITCHPHRQSNQVGIRIAHVSASVWFVFIDLHHAWKELVVTSDISSGKYETILLLEKHNVLYVLGACFGNCRGY